MDSSVSAKDEIWFLHVCHHVSNTVYTIKILDGSINSLLNINVKCTIYKVEQIKIYPFECFDI